MIKMEYSRNVFIITKIIILLLFKICNKLHILIVQRSFRNAILTNGNVKVIIIKQK